MLIRKVLFFVLLFSVCCVGFGASDNKVGMEFVPIKAGTFVMGADLSSDYITAEKAIFIQDELPARKVTISKDFDMGKYEVTNAQYEKYDPKHSALRGKAVGISADDNEAVVYVTWYDATGFCKWLSAGDEKYDYRLPTEAEWEYACRAGTRTPYNDGVSGDIYKMNPVGALAEKQDIITEWSKTRGNGAAKNISHGAPGKDIDLTVGQEGPNKWGLYDMMVGVEEMTMDWYGPYVASDNVDPVGYADGSSKVVRGGCHSVYIQTLRSANRSSSNRTDRSFLMGFRVVRVPKGQKLSKATLKQPVKQWAKGVSQKKYKWLKDSVKPYFKLSSLYDVKSEYGTAELLAQYQIPIYNHNHSPAITWCDNGDIFLAWFTGESEKDQALTVPALRGRRARSGELVWDTDVAEFYKEADRNMHGTQLWNNAVRLDNGFDEPFTLYHVNGICTDGKWSKLAMSFRRSTDNGVTWSEPVIMKQGVDDFHLDSDRNQPQGNAFTMRDGTLISISDGSPEGFDGSSFNISRDGGNSWVMNTAGNGPPGNHTNGVELNDGRVMTFSRDKGKTLGCLPKSISSDKGKTFSYHKSPFPGIGTVMRLILIRLEYSDLSLDPEGKGRKPLLLVSIAPDGMKGKDANGNEAMIYGSYAAVSWDDGETWPVRRVMSDVKSGSMKIMAGPWNREITLDATHGQPKSYWAATQAPNGVIHLNDSLLDYAFNLAWVMGK